MIAGRLTMRAAVERDTAAGTDSWGNPVAPDFQTVGDPQACFIWSVKAGEIVNGQINAQLGDHRGLFALGADLAEHDEIASVTDRAGNVLIPGRLKVIGPVEYKHTHREAALQRVR